MSVVAFRPFKIPAVAETQFFHVSDEANQNFLKEDLARSGLVQSDLWATTAAMLPLKKGAQAGYMIPYFDLTGNPIVDERGFLAMFRTRMKFPEFSQESRYDQPSREQLERLGVPSSVPYIHPLTLLLEGDELICAEGEKKTVAILKHLQLPAFGIGGCQNWRKPDRTGNIHPWIKELLNKKGLTKITIVPDGDVRRYDICTAYGTFARALENEGFTVRILDPGGKIDDLLIQWGSSALENWNHLQTLNANDLVQSPTSLVTPYDLAFKDDAKGRHIVDQHTSNIMKLLEKHNAFPRIWLNTDNNKIYVGKNIVEPNLTELDIANYFQHNFGFNKVKHGDIRTCLGGLARKNKTSPMLDSIKRVVWDRVPRIESWISTSWGLESTPYIREVSRKWLVSSCARMDKPGTKVDWILIIIGPQGTGKTSMPYVLFGDLYYPLYGEQSEKDFRMLLHSYLCLGFDELDSFNRREASTLKAIITGQEDSFRPPYGAEIEVYKRKFVLYGCGNRQSFLQYDASGYRRYAVIEVKRKIDFTMLTSMKDQLWAEAWFEYQNNPGNFWEVSGTNEIAARYAIDNIYEDKIEEFIQRKMTDKITPGKDPNASIYFKMTELLQQLRIEEYGSSVKVREISDILVAKFKCEKPIKTTRHPDTKAVGKWYIYDPSTHLPL